MSQVNSVLHLRQNNVDVMLSPTQVEQQQHASTPAQSPPLTESLKGTMKSSKMDNRGNSSEHHTHNILTLVILLHLNLKIVFEYKIQG